MTSDAPELAPTTSTDHPLPTVEVLADPPAGALPIGNVDRSPGAFAVTPGPVVTAPVAAPDTIAPTEETITTAQAATARAATTPAISEPDLSAPVAAHRRQAVDALERLRDALEAAGRSLDLVVATATRSGSTQETGRSDTT